MIRESDQLGKKRSEAIRPFLLVRGYFGSL